VYRRGSRCRLQAGRYLAGRFLKNDMRIKLRIYRFDPDSNRKPRYDTFEIDSDPGETVLSALLKVNEDYDPSLSFRFACGKVKCGECSVMVNKTPCLACNRKIEPEMIIDPLPNFTVIKDLVIDRNKAINKIVELAPCLLETKVDRTITLESHIIDTYVRFTACFECLICQSVCHVLKDKPDQFVGPLGLLWLAQTGLTDASIRKEMDNAVGMCKNCGICWKACPSEMKFLEDAIKGLLSEQKSDGGRVEVPGRGNPASSYRESNQ
jgi:succinate dehydrogenase/fumarate reductase iron-sulfur protein